MPFSSSRMRDAVASGPNYGTNHFGDSGPSDSHDIVGLESSYTKTLGASRNAVSPKIGGLMAQRVNFVTNIHLHNSEAFTSVPTPFPAMPLSRPDTPSNDSPPARKPQDLPSIPRSDEMTQIKPRDNRPKRPRERQKPNRAKPEEDADTNDPKNPDTSMVVSQFDADTDTTRTIFTDTITSTDITSHSTNSIVRTGTTTVSITGQVAPDVINIVAATSRTLVSIDNGTITTIMKASSVDVTVECSLWNIVITITDAKSDIVTTTVGTTTTTSTETDNKTLKLTLAKGGTASVPTTDAVVDVTVDSEVSVTTNAPFSQNMSVGLWNVGQ